MVLRILSDASYAAKKTSVIYFHLTWGSNSSIISKWPKRPTNQKHQSHYAKNRITKSKVHRKTTNSFLLSCVHVLFLLLLVRMLMDFNWVKYSAERKRSSWLDFGSVALPTQKLPFSGAYPIIQFRRSRWIIAYLNKKRKFKAESQLILCTAK